VDAGEEVAGGFVIARGDSPKLLESAKEVLDQVARLVEVFIVMAWISPTAFGRDDRRLAGFLERLDDALVGVEGLVGDDDVGRHAGQQRIGAVEIMGLAGGEKEAGWIAERIDGGDDLGAKSPAAASDRLLRGVFLRAPALC
jgi:hypothetical protein